MAVDVVIEGTTRLRAVANDDGLVLEGRGVNHRLAWDAVTGAGLVRMRVADVAADEPEMARLLPGMARLSSMALEMAQRNRLLLIGRARRRGRPRALVVPLPDADPNAELLIEELKQRLGPRWRGEDREQRELKKELGAAYPLWYWPVGVVFVFGVAAVTLLGTAGWAFLTGGSSDLRDARWWMFVGLALWLGLCAILFLVARRAIGGDDAWRYAAPIPLVLLLAVLTPPAVATVRLVDDWRFSDLEPAPLVALAVWLGLIVVATRLVRRLLD